jgi:hypothetical protein
LRAALIQMKASMQRDENLDRAAAMVEQAVGQGAQVVCLQECFATWFFPQRIDPEKPSCWVITGACRSHRRGRTSERVSATTAHGSRPRGGLQYAARRATDQEYAARRLKPARMLPCHQRHRLHAHAPWLA